METTTAIDLSHCDISAIAWRVIRDHKVRARPLPFACVPYLDAMRKCTDITETYGVESVQGIVLRFLGNFTSARGDVSKAVREELKKRLRANGYPIK